MKNQILILALLFLFSCSSENATPWELNNSTNNTTNNNTPNNGVTTQTTSTTNHTTQTNNGSGNTSTGTTTQFRTPVEHRPMAITCDNLRPVGAGGAKNDTCLSDADCIDGNNGRCNFGRAGAQCSYDLCFSDSDCMGSVCACEAPNDSTRGNHCLVGNCSVDADCPATGFCSPTFGGCGDYTGDVAYFCHTQEDECIDDADCADFQGVGGGAPYCKFSTESNHWVCDNSQCVG